MRILDISPRHVTPARRGSAVRVSNLLRHLSDSCEVRQICLMESMPLPTGPTREVQHSPSYREYQIRSKSVAVVSQIAERSWVRAPVLSGAALRLFPPRCLDDWLRWADVVMVEFPWQFEFIRRRVSSTPLVLASHNVEIQKFRSYAEAQGVNTTNSLWLRYIRKAEANAVRHANLILAVSADDKAAFTDEYGVTPDKVLEIPNGADTALYHPVDAEAKRALKVQLGLPPLPLVIYVGAKIPPNLVGLKWVSRVAERTDQFTFVVVGPLFSQAFRKRNFIATGMTDDYLRWLQAAGLPVVAFEESVLGTGMEPGEHLRVCGKSEDEILSALHYLVTHPGEAATMALAGREYVLAHNDWKHAANRLAKVLVDLCQNGKSPARD